MKIYIGACGIGLGHISRMLPVAEKLRALNHDIIFSTYGSACDFIKAHNFKALRAPAVGWREERGELSVRRTALAAPIEALKLMEQYKLEKKNIEQFKPDLVLSDSRYTTLLASAKLNIPVLYVANQIRFVLPSIPFKNKIENIGSRLNYRFLKRYASEVIAPDFPPPWTIGLENLQTEPWLTISFVGPIVRTLPQSLALQAELKEKLGFDPDKLLVYAAISGPGEARLRLFNLVMKAIENLDHELEFVVVRGNPYSTYEKRYGNILVRDWVKNRPALLKATDFVIARCGHATVAEIITYGKLSILVPQKNQSEQGVIARSVERLGIGKIIKEDDLLAESVKSAITELTQDEKTKKSLKKLGELQNQYDGAKNIVERVLSYV